jgi:hypothetical protein
MNVFISEEEGNLKVTDLEGKILSKVYIKCFTLDQYNATKFHKDGYTDIRGKFNYLDVNSASNSSYKYVSIFIMSDTHGI